MRVLIDVIKKLDKIKPDSKLSVAKFPGMGSAFDVVKNHPTLNWKRAWFVQTLEFLTYGDKKGTLFPTQGDCFRANFDCVFAIQEGKFWLQILKVKIHPGESKL